MEQGKGKVFVSGASGFVAGHVVELLLKRGYEVVGSVRSLQNEKKIEHLKKIQPEQQQNLTLVEGDLTNKENWVNIMKGCDYLIHTASPFPIKTPQDPNEIIMPALEGTENVISAAIQNNIKKIVLTSSVAAVSSGRTDKNFFSEEDWSNLENSGAYEKSKHLAEKKAWELINNHKKDGGNIEMATINPAFVQGPSHTSGNSFTSSDVIIQIMTNKLPGLAKISMGYVDVREVAIAHVNALEKNEANGNRYLLVQGSYWLEDIANILRAEFEKFGYKIPSTVFGSVTLTIASFFDQTAKAMKPMVGRMLQNDNSASQKDLGVQYRSIRETLLDTVYDLIEKGRIPNLLPKDHEKTHRKSKFQYEL